MISIEELWNWARVESNRPPLEIKPGHPVFEAGWSTEHGASALEHAWFRGAAAETELLVIITTHARPAGARSVLESLARSLEEWVTGSPRSWRVLVFEDPSSASYEETRKGAHVLFGERLLWLRTEAHAGKPGFWVTYQLALLVAESCQARHVLFLQDDLELSGSFLSSAMSFSASLAPEAEAQPLVLNLFASEDDERFGRWVLYRRRAVPGLPLRRTQWFDLAAFLINRAALEALSYRMIPVHPNRWRRRPKLSSGVGRQLTRRLSSRAAIYQCYPPLAFHGSLPSQMNPGARRKRIMDNRALRRSP